MPDSRDDITVYDDSEDIYSRTATLLGDIQGKGFSIVSRIISLKEASRIEEKQKILEGLALKIKVLTESVERYKGVDVEDPTIDSLITLDIRFQTISDVLARYEAVPDSLPSAVLDSEILRLEHISKELQPHQTPKESQADFSDLIRKTSTLQHKYNEKLEDINKVQLSIQQNAENSLSRFEKTAEQIFEQSKASFDQIIQEKTEKIAAEIITIQSIVEQAREFQQELSGRTLGDFFSKRAEKEKRLALSWTIATWTFALLILVVLAYTFFYPLDPSINEKVYFSQLSTKILAVATLGFLAKWTSKRSTRHLMEESKFHKLSINMVTIESYVSKLDEKTRNEFLKEVGLNIFCDTSSNESPSTELDAVSVVDGVKALLQKNS